MYHAQALLCSSVLYHFNSFTQRNFVDEYFYILQFAISLLLGNSSSMMGPRSYKDSILYGGAMIIGVSSQPIDFMLFIFFSDLIGLAAFLDWFCCHQVWC
jgi:hypothetical protein